MTFEQNLNKLEEIVEKLNQNEVGIEESIKLFEKGVLVSEQALSALNEGQGKITILKQRMDELLDESK